MSRTSMVSAPETRGQTAGALLPLFLALRLGLPVFELRTLEDKDSKWPPALTGVTRNLPKMEGAYQHLASGVSIPNNPKCGHKGMEETERERGPL